MKLPTRQRLADLACRVGLAEASIGLSRLTSTTPHAPSQATGRVMLAPDAELSPASMIKVPIAAAVATLWLQGELRREDRVAVDAANLTVNDAASPLAPQFEVSLEELVRLMLTRSDNVATNELIDVAERSRINRIVHALGLAATFVRRKLSGSLPLVDDPASLGRNAHPMPDAVRLFESIATGTVPHADWLLHVLGEQEWNDKLSCGLRAGDRFAHKTGDTDEVSHDGGILDLYGGTRFVLVVYTGLPSSPEVDARFAAFMHALRPHLD